jgi:effector-binding domain-containing protein
MTHMAKVRIEEREELSIAYIEHTGPYDTIPWPEYIERLYAWAKERKVVPGLYPMGIYLDDPYTTTKEELRSQIAIPFSGVARGGDGIRTKTLPAMTVATLSHNGPSCIFKKSYDELERWVEANGYKCSGPPIEVYTKSPEVVRGRTVLHAKIMAPVRKA